MGDVLKFRACGPARAESCRPVTLAGVAPLRLCAQPFSVTAYPGAVALVITANEMSPEQARRLARELVRMAYYADGCTPEGGS